MPSQLTTRDLVDTVGRAGLVVIDCWGEGCVPCRVFATIFDRVAATFPEVHFARVNVDQEPAVAHALQVPVVPFTVLFRDGVPLYEQPGVISEVKLKRLVETALAFDMSEVERALAE